MGVRGAFEERYELQDRLGRGGMGEVWRARDRQLDRPVAVKFLRSRSGVRDLSDARRLEQRFEREARLTSRIGHPGVPVIHENGRCQDNRLYIVMELVDGKTLAQLVRKEGRFQLARAAAVAVQTAHVLAHAHRIHVIHRDLKLSNLMFTGNGTVKVLDFGIAAALKPDAKEPQLTRTSEMPGTPGFISPEQGEGGDVTAESDLYALGCVLYEITAGKPPFEVEPGASPLFLIHQHVYNAPLPVTEHRAELPQNFADLIMGLLAKNPAQRPSAQEVQDVARSHLEPQSQTAPRGPADAPPPAPQPGRSHGSAVEKSASSALEEARELAARGAHSAAVARLEEHLHSARQALDDVGLLPLRLALCELRLTTEDFTRAYDGYFALGNALRRDRPRTDRDVLVCRAGAARCLSGLGRTPEALHEFEALLPVQQHVFGGVDRTVFDTRYEIAVLSARGGQVQAARDQLAGLLSDQQRILPADDEQRARTEALLQRLDRLLGSSSPDR
ncbi:serine/threonine protein kinase [Streptomyces sp. NBC_01186]|uniref:serine/threonine-protein kinase n=1 Tax=Streptomyces sp. NBC_01186 TaxID=2903765 RepID=UPI002E0DE148|nr:serine/threonine protein kinase [Streptomyces sp. NBC_01186]